MMDWFEKLTGFREESGRDIAGRLELDGTTITSRVNGRSMEHGTFSMPSVAELRRERPIAYSQLRVDQIVGDAKTLHVDASNRGSVFQVASQFNMLEMISPSVTPYDGVTRYQYDPTQGPACAIACGAATVYRNYFVPVDGRVGQSARHQLNGVADLASALDVDIPVRNGYALPSTRTLKRINERLTGLDEPERDELMGYLRIGVHADTEVTLPGGGHCVNQVFCSAMPIAYSRQRASLWEPLARLILDAAYEATLHVALSRHEQGSGDDQRHGVFLTSLGGGAFGNPVEWIHDATIRALTLFRTSPLDVHIVGYKSTDRVLDQRLAPGWPDPIFNDDEVPWGLRGDPHLWFELRNALRRIAKPDTPAELHRLALHELQRLAGSRFRSSLEIPDVSVELRRYEHGGMSGGHVHPHTWSTKLLPLLERRFAEL